MKKCAKCKEEISVFREHKLCVICEVIEEEEAQIEVDKLPSAIIEKYIPNANPGMITVGVENLMENSPMLNKLTKGSIGEVSDLTGIIYFLFLTDDKVVVINFGELSLSLVPKNVINEHLINTLLENDLTPKITIYQRENILNEFHFYKIDIPDWSFYNSICNGNMFVKGIKNKLLVKPIQFYPNKFIEDLILKKESRTPDFIKSIISSEDDMEKLFNAFSLRKLSEQKSIIKLLNLYPVEFKEKFSMNIRDKIFNNDGEGALTFWLTFIVAFFAFIISMNITDSYEFSITATIFSIITSVSSRIYYSKYYKPQKESTKFYSTIIISLDWAKI